MQGLPHVARCACRLRAAPAGCHDLRRCFTCHDGTQGYGVYGTIAARNGIVGAGHDVDLFGTNVVPGGDASTGGAAVMSFSGVDGHLTCTDCHSPHNSNTVANFQGDRIKISGMAPALAANKFLKKQPGGSPTPVDEYGSDWCLACHQGRRYAIPGVHNHPSDSGAGAFTYGNAAILASVDPSFATTMGTLGYSHRGYLMPWDSVNETRTPAQQDHYPICQQCHEDSRDVGTLSSDGLTADVATWTPSRDGLLETANPRFQNFPHETTNEKLLVETRDDLCLNCHTASQLN